MKHLEKNQKERLYNNKVIAEVDFWDFSEVVLTSLKSQ
jgi:hypothetical protein